MSAPAPDKIDSILGRARRLADELAGAYRWAWSIGYEPGRSPAADNARRSGHTDPTADHVANHDRHRHHVRTAARHILAAWKALEDADKELGAAVDGVTPHPQPGYPGGRGAITADEYDDALDAQKRRHDTGGGYGAT